jgi:calcium-dependent protein kinase
MFSTDMLGDYMEDLGNLSDYSSDSDPPLSAQTTEVDVEPSKPSHPRPSGRDDRQGSVVSSTMTDKTDEQNAYITGVFRDVATKYEVSNVVVGSGGFGEVRECNDKKTGQTHVVKTITKPTLDDTAKINLIRNEILLLHEAKHPNIIELKDLFEDSKYVHIVMERCTGGDLFDRVVNENPARIRHRAEAIRHEARTASAMRSIMQVIKYLHSKVIVHRDIKPEHFLLTSETKESQRIKLIDFGLARKHKKGSPPMTTFTGSPSFVAPEVIARSYDHMCDLFSTGVTAYFLLTGMLPFDGPSDEDTFDLISIGVFRFPSSSIHLSDDARDFVTRLLKVDPKKRMTAEEALNHPWLKKDASC